MHPRCGWLTSLLPLMHALTWRVRACRNSLVFHSLDKVAAHWGASRQLATLHVLHV